MFSFSCLSCALFGILASLQSGASGCWLLTTFVLLGLLIINRYLISKKVAISMLFFSIIIAVLSYHKVASRVNLVLRDVNQLSEKITLTPQLVYV